MGDRRRALASGIALALAGASANAAGVDEIFSVRGFGTLGAVYSSQDEGDYVRDMYAQLKGAGYSDTVSAEVDSKTALQIDARFNDRFSAVVQIVSEAMYNNSWDNEPQKMWYPSLEWANVSYRVTDSFTVRAGRVVLPLLMSADYQKVGYANHWMRGPVELYGKIAYTNIDGVDAWYDHKIGDATNTLRIYAGESEAERAPPLSPFKARTYGILDTYEKGALTLRAAYQYTDVEAPGGEALTAYTGMASVFTMMGLTAAANKANEIADLMGNGLSAQMAAIGAAYDAGGWFVSAEAFKSWGPVMVPKHISGYVSGGVRQGQWTPYFTVAHTDVKDFDGFIPTAGLSGPLLMGVEMANAGVATSISYTQTTASVGVRWDVMSNIAVKAQYDYVALPGDSYGMFSNRQPGFKPGEDASVFGLSLDFVF